jgi:hypothetical protein
MQNKIQLSTVAYVYQKKSSPASIIKFTVNLTFLPTGILTFQHKIKPNTTNTDFLDFDPV